MINCFTRIDFKKKATLMTECRKIRKNFTQRSTLTLCTIEKLQELVINIAYWSLYAIQ
jgi:hypothetical protein